MTNYRLIKKPSRLDKLASRIATLRFEANRNLKEIDALRKRQRILVRHIEWAETEADRMIRRDPYPKRYWKIRARRISPARQETN
jgi:hypothetical protein